MRRVLCVIAVLMAAPVWAGPANTPAPAQVATNAGTRAIAQIGNTVFVGGLFTRVGTPTGPFVLTHQITGALTPVAGGLAGAFINAIIADGGGGFFVAGAPFSAGGQHGVSVIRVKSDGTIDPTFAPVTVNGEVKSMAMYNAGNILIGGSFDKVNGQTRANLASISTSGTLSPWSQGTDGPVHAVLYMDNKVYVGGSFLNAAGQPRQNLARFDPTAGMWLTPWVANVNGPVYALAFGNSVGLWIGGSYSTVNGTPRSNLALVASNLDSNNLQPFNQPVAGVVRALLANLNKQVFVGGEFSLAGGQSRSRLAAFDQPTNSLMAWAPAANGTVRTIESGGTGTYIGGDFTQVNGQERQYAALVNASTGALLGWDASPLGPVHSIEQSLTTVGVGGSFAGAASVPRPYLAAIDASTGALLPQATTVDGPVFDLQSHNGLLYLAGLFTKIGGQTRRYAAAIDANGVLQGFNPDPTSAVYRIGFFHNQAWLGGLFQQINTNLTAPYAAVVDAATGALIQAFPNTDGAVTTWHFDGTHVWAGGSFTKFAGASESRLVALDEHGAVVPGAPDVAGGMVRALAGDASGTIYAAGDFTAIDGHQRPGLAAFDGLSGVITAFNAQMKGNGRALAAFGSRLIVGGSLYAFASTQTGSIVEVETIGGSLGSFVPELEGDVYALLVSGNSVWAAGDFVNANGQPRKGLVRFDNSAPTMTAIGDATIDEDNGIAVNFTIGDAETPASLLDVSALSSSQQAIPNASIVVSGSGAARTLTVTPPPNVGGVSAVITVTTSDGQLSATRVFTINITAVNDAPSMQAMGPVTVNEDTPGSVDLDFADAETPAAQLTLSATSSNEQAIPASSLVFSGSGSNRQLGFAPAANAGGVSSEITVTVSDGQLSASKSFTVTVAGVNDPPTLQQIGSVAVEEDKAESVFIAVDDIDTPAAQLVLSATSSNQLAVPAGGLHVEGSGALRSLMISPAPNASGLSSVITLAVSDGQSSASHSFTVNVTGGVDDPPAIDPIAPATVSEDASAQVTVYVSDPENQTLSVSATSSNLALLPDAGIAIGGAGTVRQLTLQPAANAHGTATVTVAVSDGKSSVSATFLLTVQPVNDPLAVTPVANVVVAKGQPVPPIQFSVTDVDGDLTSASARSLDQSRLPDAAVQTLQNGTGYTVTIAPPADFAGTVPMEIRAIDGSGAATSPFTLTILADEETPEQPVNLRAEIDGNRVTLLWDAVPGGGSADGYLVEAALTPGGLELPLQLTHSAERSYTTPVPNGVYFVRIRAMFAGSLGPRSEEIAIAVGASLVTIPGAPTGLAAALQGSTVSLSWRAPIAGGAAAGYRLEAGSAPGLADIASAPIGGTVFTTTGVPAGQYYVRVRGINALGTGPASNEIRIDVAAAVCDAQPARPLLLPPTVSGSQVTLSWTPSAAQQYRVLAGTAPGVMNLVNYPTGQAATAFVATAPAGTYYVQVVAENACGASAPSNEMAVVVADPLAVPGAPGGLTAAVNGGLVTLTWVPPAGGSLPTGYLIEAGSQPGAVDLARVPTGNATALFGAGGVPGGTYHVRVRAMNAGGISPVSNEIVLVVP